ncbi:MAG: hypothetical protein BGO96_04565 [Micrococcales bacterium 73-15]|nr:MAG: hypothetical protein BGO96_04565 [Micrococcales bacterium 73-15]
MVAEYRVEPRVHKVLTFVVRNVGPTAAKDVRVVFEPPIEEASASQALRQFVRDRYAEEIPTLGPGQELTNLVYYDSEDPEKTDLPDDLKVTISFKGYRRRRYSSEFRLRASVYKHHTYQTTSDSVEGRLKVIALASKTSSEALRSIAQTMIQGRRNDARDE